MMETMFGLITIIFGSIGIVCFIDNVFSFLKETRSERRKDRENKKKLKEHEHIKTSMKELMYDALRFDELDGSFKHKDYALYSREGNGDWKIEKVLRWKE